MSHLESTVSQWICLIHSMSKKASSLFIVLPNFSLSQNFNCRNITTNTLVLLNLISLVKFVRPVNAARCIFYFFFSNSDTVQEDFQFLSFLSISISVSTSGILSYDQVRQLRNFTDNILCSSDLEVLYVPVSWDINILS